MTVGKGIEIKPEEMETLICNPGDFGSSINRINALKQMKQNFGFPTLSSILLSDVPIRVVLLLDVIKCYLKQVIIRDFQKSGREK